MVPRKLLLLDRLTRRNPGPEDQVFNTGLKWLIVSNEMVSVEAARKPNSVPEPGYPCTGNDHSSKDSGCPKSRATYPGAWTGHPQALPYLVLHRMGFTKLPRSPGELVRSYRTFSPLPRMRCRILRRYTFCCTILHVAATPRYGASCPTVFGLSSRRFFAQRSFRLLRPIILLCFPNISFADVEHSLVPD